VNPNVVALGNGFTWNGHRQLTPSDACTNLLASARNEFTVYCHQSAAIDGERFRMNPVSK